jgi:hypothetical protein
MSQASRGEFGWATMGRTLLLVLGIAMGGMAQKARAAETEVREFAIFVDHKIAGTYQMSISKEDNGVIVMKGKAGLRVKHLVFTYTYAYEGTETWKDGRLLGLKSQTNDNGKRFKVVAAAESEGLRVTVNDRPRLTRADVWLTSYWRLPDAKFRNQAVPLLDADTGKDINGQLKFVGLEMVTVAGQKVKCNHYRVTGTPSPIELWYDGSERLIRQATVEQGLPTVISLTHMRR